MCQLKYYIACTADQFYVFFAHSPANLDRSTLASQSALAKFLKKFVRCVDHRNIHSTM